MERLFVIVATVLFTGTARAADFFEGADPSAEIVKSVSRGSALSGKRASGL